MTTAFMASSREPTACVASLPPWPPWPPG